MLLLEQEMKALKKQLALCIQEKYNPHHDANGRFTTSDNAYIRIHRDGRRELGPKHPDYEPPSRVPSMQPDGVWFKKYVLKQIDAWKPFVPKGSAHYDFVAQADAHAQKLTSGAQMWARRSMNGIERILDDGKFKTAFDVAPKPGAKYSLDQRAQAEKNLFGIPKDAPSDQRPIYGYLSEHADGSNNWRLDGYGDVAIRFKRSALEDHTTISAEDSMGSTGGGMQPLLVPQPLTSPNSSIFNVSHNPNPFQSGVVNPLKISSIEDGMSNNKFRYIETHIHKQVGPKHIEEVVFHGRKPSTALQGKLKKHSISWRMA